MCWESGVPREGVEAPYTLPSLLPHTLPCVSPLFGFLNKGIEDFPGGAVVKNPPAMQGTRVRALVQEDPTCRGATKPVRHNY